MSDFVGSGTLENGETFEIGTDGLVIVAGKILGRVTREVILKAASLENFSAVDVVSEMYVEKHS